MKSTPDPLAGSAWIIANPIAGGRWGQGRLDQAVRLLQARLSVGEVRWTQERGDAESWAREAVEKKVALLLGAGGDGTLNEIANGLAGSDVVFGILPCGTANVVACELHLPLDPLHAAESLLRGEIKRIHIGCAEFQPLHLCESSNNARGDRAKRFFLFAAGLGFDAYVCHHVNLRFKHLARKTAYVVDGIRLFLRYPSPRLRVAIDGGEPTACSELIVCNTRAYAGRFWVAPDASFHDPNLDVCLMRRPGRLNLLRYTFGIMLGRHTRYADVECRKAQTIDVRSENTAYLHIDGDTLGTPPVRFTIQHHALSVLMPPAEKAPPRK